MCVYHALFMMQISWVWGSRSWINGGRMEWLVSARIVEEQQVASLSPLSFASRSLLEYKSEWYLVLEQTKRGEDKKTREVFWKESLKAERAGFAWRRQVTPPSVQFSSGRMEVESIAGDKTIFWSNVQLPLQQFWLPATDSRERDYLLSLARPSFQHPAIHPRFLISLRIRMNSSRDHEAHFNHILNHSLCTFLNLE